ncbi:unnamed protein product, partial [Medioppia subpectinata]
PLRSHGLDSVVNSAERYSDRYTPIRESPNWDIRFTMIQVCLPFLHISTNVIIRVFCVLTQKDGSKSVSAKKTAKESISESNKDGIAYQCLLKNELLGAGIEDMKEHTEERKIFLPLESKNLFRYRVRESDSLNEPTSPYSLSPVSSKSQKLLRSPRKTARKISKIPFKVLDAPELQDDFYLNLVDWSTTNILSVGLGTCVYLWSACTSQVTRLCDLSADGDSVTSVSWAERGHLVAVGTHRGLVQVWDVAANKRLTTLEGHTARVGALAWNSDTLSSGSRDRHILQRDVRGPPHQSERRLVGHRQEVCGLKWSPDNQHLASGGNDNRLFVWNSSSTTPVQTYTEHLAAVKAIAWSPHHHGLLASGGGTADRCIRFWNTLTGQPMQCVDTGSQVCNLSWSKHASELVSTHGYSQNQILVWKYPSLVQVAKLTGHSYRVLYLAMSPDGESIVTGAGDETLRFWNVFSKTRSQKEAKSALNLFSIVDVVFESHLWVVYKAMNAEKLNKLSSQVRIGGKGTARRKKKVVHRTATTDDKKLQNSLKKLTVNPIPGIEEVNMIKDDGTVIHFNNPKVQASLAANTFAITGQAESKRIADMVPGILSQLRAENFSHLKQLANVQSVGTDLANTTIEEDDDEVPDLVENFDEVAKADTN